MVIANILFLASKFETKLKNFGKEIFCEKRKFTGHRRNFRIAVVEALLVGNGDRILIYVYLHGVVVKRFNCEKLLFLSKLNGVIMY